MYAHACVCAYVCVCTYPCVCTYAHMYKHMYKRPEINIGYLPQSLSTLLFEIEFSPNQPDQYPMNEHQGSVCLSASPALGLGFRSLLIWQACCQLNCYPSLICPFLKIGYFISLLLSYMNSVRALCMVTPFQTQWSPNIFSYLLRVIVSSSHILLLFLFSCLWFFTLIFTFVFLSLGAILKKGWQRRQQ